MDFIKKYSPYHNIKPGTFYPSMLIIASEMDTRVVPLHSFKYAAALQEAREGEGVILLNVKGGAGHFADDIEDNANILAFMIQELRKQSSGCAEATQFE